MTEKLEFFAEIIEREIETKRRRQKHQLANDFAKKTAAAIEAAQEKTEFRVKAARNSLIRAANRKIALALTEAKAEYFRTRKHHQAKMLESVRQELKKFANSAEYDNYLQERIKQIKETLPFAATEVKHHPEGGFILQSENGKLRADYTFNTRLNAYEQD